MKQARRSLPEAAYIPQVRRVLVASQLREKAAQDELDAKRSAASLMHSVSVTEFRMRVEGKTYDVSLDRRSKTEISVRKLYTLLANNEITLDEFLDAIEAPLGKVNKILAPDQVSYLSETVRGGLDLYITEVS